MIAQTTIDKINDLDIVEVIAKHVVLKKQGANFIGSSPFKEENTPSFIVSPGKGIWKCFGSGEGGSGGISFVMKKDNLPFPEAVISIATSFNVFVDYDDSDDSKENVKKREEEANLYNINSFAAEVFQENFIQLKIDVKKKDLGNLKLSDKPIGLVIKKIYSIFPISEKYLRTSDEMAELFGIGYSTGEFKDVLARGLEKGISKKDLISAGLVKEGGKGTFDVFNKRIMFPILDHRSRVIGFGGRDPDYKKGDKFPKYINTKETSVYSKSTVLFGIHLAKKQIFSQDKANIVEGYYDVIAMFEDGYDNTVSPSGTSFTLPQAKMLKKWCSTIRLIFDTDAAGIKAAERAIRMLIPLKFEIEICFFPPGHDPDSYEGDLGEYISNNTVDAIEWLSERIFDGADSVVKKSKAEHELEKLLSEIPNTRLRSTYIKALSKTYKISKAEIESNIKSILVSKREEDREDEDFVKLPAGVDREQYEKYGFYEQQKQGDKNTGYWFINQTGKFEQRSNFIIKPLFHIESKTDNKRLIQITNHRIEKIIDVPSKGFINSTQFEEAVINEGFFYFIGTKPNFQKIMVKILEKFPSCREIKTLGWQRAGFWSFANGIIDQNFKKVDHYGIVSFDEQKYFLPAFSEVYKNVQIEDDLYENDRHFIYRKSDVSFKSWAVQFVRVHGENGKIGIAFFMATLFRDHIHRIHQVFPHLFMFGSVGTGKSYCARSINAIFHGEEQGFNLSTGTNVGFSRRLAKFLNGSVWFDEYDNDMDIKRFQQLKAAYDGLGHEKGTMSRDNRTETTKVNAASIISGQYLPTRDDNSLYTRSIVLEFKRKAEDLTHDDIIAGDILKSLERAGLSDLIVDIIKYRELIEDKYSKINLDVQKTLKDAMTDDEYSGRVMLNFSIVLTIFKILEDKLPLPFSYDQLFNQSVKMIVKQSDQINDSDALRTFWKMMEFNFSEGKINGKVDFKIESINHLTISVDRKQTEKKEFKHTTKCLFIRFTKIHPLYMEAHRKQFGENGVADTSIKQYMKNHKSFIGFTPATAFDNTKTSAFVFDYNHLGLELEHGQYKDPKEGVPHPSEPREKVDLPF